MDAAWCEHSPALTQAQAVTSGVPRRIGSSGTGHISHGQAAISQRRRHPQAGEQEDVGGHAKNMES